MSVVGWVCLVLSVWTLVRMFVGLRAGVLVMGTPIALILPGGDRASAVRRILVNLASGLATTTVLVIAGLTLIGVLS